MDSGQIPHISSVTDRLSQLSRTSPVGRGVGEGHQSEPATSSTSGRVDQTAKTVHMTAEQLFALEQHVPIQILQNPQLLKAEWAWKLLVLQELTKDDIFKSSEAANPSPSVESGASEASKGPSQGNPYGTRNADSVNDVSKVVAQHGRDSATGPISVREHVMPSNATHQTASTGQAQVAGNVDRTLVQSLESQSQTEHASNQQQFQNAPENRMPGNAARAVDGQQVRNSGSQASPGAATTNQAAAGSSEMTHPQMNQAELAVRQLWTILTASSAQAHRTSGQIQMNFKPDPPVLPFSSMNQDTIALAHDKSDAQRLENWVVQDRLVSSVLDNPYERQGAGLFFTSAAPPTGNESPQTAVKWTAQRQTRVGTGGKLIHRVRFDLEVSGRPLTCIVTASRPQLLVHFVTDDRKLLTHLERGESVVTAPLKAAGWELIGWTAGQPTTDEMEGKE
ncbi:hypothetical protein [Alicyclobacillus dauci]|uniref:Hook-length control protein FliK n=1 Tax=Alicyclobacillus dauci TaxID=1475485 RepID=A0ABY6YY54_9BACL|nr:hypothetical protein [Alicyclobacillus dauci]WAH35440.1 hypothetical protein NZD86_14155 [Alicyclobacillus dauci]